MKKIESLQNIKDVNSLGQIIMDISKITGLKNITKIGNNIISAEEESKFKNKILKFILTLSELKSKVPQIAEIIKKEIADTDEIIILTTNKKEISKYFKEWIIKETGTTKIDFWNQSELISYIDKYLPHYWGHNDFFLKSYEDNFLKDIQEEVELKKILKLDSKFENLLNVFIEPKIYIFKEDKETERTTQVKIPTNRFLKKDNFFVSGDAGTGKSTLLKQLGKLAIDNNRNKGDNVLPVFMKSTDIQTANYSIETAIRNILAKDFGIDDFDKIFNDYHLFLLVDSIDEFEKTNQQAILENLSSSKFSYNFIVCTRNYENLTNGYELSPHFHAKISNFDQRQVKQYLDNFFKFDLTRANQLWESLQDNNILDRIPVTPLTISLVSILYEERQYEVPATLTDIYDNFNQFLLGRATVKSNLEFLDINIKERILSIYAYSIIKTPNRKRKTKAEFIKFVRDFFSEKSITIEEDLVPELLISITEGTGILVIEENGFVTFKHDHFMEYYASREMYIKHDRKAIEQELIDNFTKHNWQNTAIFYTGRTKDMPEFLKNLIKGIENHTQLDNCLLSISGIGYILQSLWMTDSKIRKNGVITALNLLLKADENVKKLAQEKVHFFNGIRDIDIAFMNLVWFYNHFNSIAIKDPLKLAFEEIYTELGKISDTVFENDQTPLLYQLFCIASTLDTGRNADSSKLEQLFDQEDILNNPFFVILFEEGSKILELPNEKILKEKNKTKSRLTRYRHAVRFYLDTPAEELRFTSFNKLAPIKEVKLFTEGKTDATIISHAFSVISSYKEPYWSITSMERVTKKSGGANELRKHLEYLGQNIELESDSSKIVIGIFDNDAKGQQEFGGLNKSEFTLIHKCLKKHNKHNVFALKLPIPDSENYEPYIQEKQEFKFFAIEHYFSKEYLEDKNMIKQTSIPGVFEIIGGKNDFSNVIQKETDTELFINFPILFRAIDEICHKEMEYLD
ncbi:NACHT domain-containing protein [Labilibaculum euxinus]